MSKKSTSLFVLFSGILLLSNFFSGYINTFTEGITKSYFFQTEKAEFEYWTMPSKGRSIEMMEDSFTAFKKAYPEYSDLKVYRTFNINPFKFWNWYHYLVNKHYDYEYREEIK